MQNMLIGQGVTSLLIMGKMFPKTGAPYSDRAEFLEFCMAWGWWYP